MILPPDFRTAENCAAHGGARCLELCMGWRNLRCDLIQETAGKVRANNSPYFRIQLQSQCSSEFAGASCQRVRGKSGDSQTIGNSIAKGGVFIPVELSRLSSVPHVASFAVGIAMLDCRARKKHGN